MADPAVTRLTSIFSDQMRALAYRYTSGQIDLGTWQIEMRALLRKQYAMQIIAAAGQDPAAINPNDWLKMGSELQFQYRHLEQFAHDITSGKTAPGQIEARAALYAQSSKQMYYMQNAGDVRLPAYPGDGSTRCLTNCQCTWSKPVQIKDRNGIVTALDFTWQLHPAEHCPQCEQRSRRWAPLRMPV